jgi:pyrophosphatase PpaX
MSRYSIPIDGAIECVLRLLANGFLVALVSNGTREMVDEFMKHFGLEKRVHLSLSSDDVVRAKPDPFPILYTLQYLDVVPTESVMVGDSATDIFAGRKAGLPTVGVLSGVADRSDLEACEADCIVDSVADLPTVLGLQD